MFGFTKHESIAVSFILLVIISATSLNLLVSLRRSRDNQRKSDIRAIQEALSKYQNDFAIIPLADNSKIAACEGYLDQESIYHYSACQWGEDSLKDLTDASYAPYLEKIPRDPHYNKGVEYRFESNGRRFQIFTALEGEDEPEYDEEVIARNLKCGSKICNFGLGLSDTPVNITLDEYERILEEKEEMKRKK